MKEILIFAVLTLTFFDLISQNRESELNLANQNVLSIKIKQERIEIGKKYIEIYKDSTNSLTFEEISITDPEKFISYSRYNDDFKKKTNYWIKFQIKNISDKAGEWALEFRDIPFLDIYLIDESSGLERQSAGTMVPASEKQMNSGIRETVIFTLQSNEVKFFYVKFQYLFNTRAINAISVSDTISSSSKLRLTI